MKLQHLHALYDKYSPRNLGIPQQYRDMCMYCPESSLNYVLFLMNWKYLKQPCPFVLIFFSFLLSDYCTGSYLRNNLFHTILRIVSPP